MPLPEVKSPPARYLDRAIKVCLYLLAFAAPLSIAATQIAWSFGLLFWIIRLFLVRPRGRRDAFDLALIAFVGLTILSSVFSYEPRVSTGKLIGVSLITIVYLVSEHVSDLRSVRTMVGLLLLAAAVSSVWAIGVFAVGKNLRLVHLTPESPLRLTQPYPIQDGDTILAVNGKKVTSPTDLAEAGSGDLELTVFRYEWVFEANVPAPHPDLGVIEWSRGRDARATGFYGHYTTFAEALQLTIALAVGLMLSVPGGIRDRRRWMFGAVVILCSIGLLLTVTRASWAGAAVASGVMVLLSAGRRTLLILAPLAVLLAAGSLWYLAQKRNVGFIDKGDMSTTWRTTVWREALGLTLSSPRNLALGVGMDSVKTRWPEWHMFDDGRLPTGHMHSDYVSFAFERGVPALIAWIVWMMVYLKMLWSGFRDPERAWTERGLLLGAFGGTIGFMTGGLVHYNWGDSEVVQILFTIMGLSLAVLRVVDQKDEKIDTAL